MAASREEDGVGNLDAPLGYFGFALLGAVLVLLLTAIATSRGYSLAIRAFGFTVNLYPGSARDSKPHDGDQ